MTQDRSYVSYQSNSLHFEKPCPAINRKYLVEGEGGGVEVMLIGAPDWEGGDPRIMSSESTVEGEAGVMTDWISFKLKVEMFVFPVFFI